MKTIGILLKEARFKSKLSRKKLENLTKIKESFIRAIEEEDWKNLPEYPDVSGFVKSIAQALGVDKKQAVALFRRDYPPKPINPNPKPEIGKKFVWGPKLTFLAGTIITVLVLVLYLTYQYFSFFKPPNLEVNEPKDGAVITQSPVEVDGKTDSDAVVKVNNQPVIVDENGNFSTKVEIFAGTNEVVVKATSRSKRETQVVRKIIPKLGS